MRRYLPAIALGCLLAVGALGAVALVRPGTPTSPQERADALAHELRCPDCEGLSVADSPTRSAQQIRREVTELIEAGADDEEVRAHFVERYGEWILLAPRATALWLIPFVVVVGGALGLGAWLIGRGRSAPPVATPISDQERRRLHDEAEALDA